MAFAKRTFQMDTKPFYGDPKTLDQKRGYSLKEKTQASENLQRTDSPASEKSQKSDTSDNDEIYIVSKIVSHRISNGLLKKCDFSDPALKPKCRMIYA